MKTEEAVKWIFDIWHEWENVYGYCGEQNLKEGKKLDEVIELLRHGEENEKHKAIVNELKNNYGYYHLVDKGKMCSSFTSLLDMLELKYFPKETDKHEAKHEA